MNLITSGLHLTQPWAYSIKLASANHFPNFHLKSVILSPTSLPYVVTFQYAPISTPCEKFEVFTTMKIQVEFFWFVMPCDVVAGYQKFLRAVLPPSSGWSDWRWNFTMKKEAALTSETSVHHQNPEDLDLKTIQIYLLPMPAACRYHPDFLDSTK
jgi:hypothetical protein